MTMKPHVLLALALVLAAFHAEAAITITPASPTSQDPITAVIDVSGACFNIVTTSVTGSTIRTDIVQQGCIVIQPLPLFQEYVKLGPLAPGTYTYDVYVDYEHTGPFLYVQRTVVVAPPVPSLSDLGLSILAISLAGIACFALGRHG
jgi:hypothetical protein